MMKWAGEIVKAKKAILVAAVAFALAASALQGCAVKPSGEAKTDIGDGIYDVKQSYAYKNPRSGEERYYFLISNAQGDHIAVSVTNK